MTIRYFHPNGDEMSEEDIVMFHEYLDGTRDIMGNLVSCCKCRDTGLMGSCDPLDLRIRHCDCKVGRIQ